MKTKSGFIDIRVTWYRKSMHAATAGGRNRTKTKSLPLIGGSLNHNGLATWHDFPDNTFNFLIVILAILNFIDLKSVKTIHFVL